MNELRALGELRACPDEVGNVLVSRLPLTTSVLRYARRVKHRYTRSLVYRDAQLELLVLCWDGRARSPIHDHGGQSCWLMPVLGEVECHDFLRGEPGQGLVRSGPPRILSGGDLDHRTHDQELHRIQLRPGVPMGVTMHLYARPVDRCAIFDERSGRAQSARLSYDFQGPR